MKKGLIKISNQMYINEWHIINSIMKDFRPTHIEFRHWENDIWYLYGVCDLFDEVKEGEGIPEYTIEITKKSEGNYTYKFKKG